MAETTWKNRIVGHGEESPEQLAANPKNWRIHPERQQKVLEGAIKDVGYISSVTVNKRTGYVLDGHLRVSLAISSGQPTIPVEYVDLNEAEEAEALATLDPIAGLAAADAKQLSELVSEIEDADGAVLDYLSELTDGLDIELPIEGATDPDDVPEASEEPVAKRGDVWILGKHRLMCGDATVVTDVERLMDGEKAAVLWTDPPYGVNYVGKTEKALTLSGDTAEDAHQLFADALACADSVMEPGAAFYVAHPPGALSVGFGAAVLFQGWRLHQTLVWVKDSMVLGHSDYHYKHEPILYGYTTSSNGRRGRGHNGWYGDHSQTSVLEFARPKASREHPTAKPVELISYCLENSSKHGDVILDLFGGSGSTLMAAEVVGREARIVELDPKYADVVCRRYQQHTGTLPVLEATGETHDFTKETASVQ